MAVNPLSPAQKSQLDFLFKNREERGLTCSRLKKKRGKLRFSMKLQIRLTGEDAERLRLVARGLESGVVVDDSVAIRLERLVIVDAAGRSASCDELLSSTTAEGS